MVGVRLSGRCWEKVSQSLHQSDSVKSHRFQHRWPACSWQPHVFTRAQKKNGLFSHCGLAVSSAIIVMCSVFTWTHRRTEILHMSRMIHLLAWAHNPLHLRWIIYVTVRRAAAVVCQLTLMFSFTFTFPDEMWRLTPMTECTHWKLGFSSKYVK